jgi:hypothetical protein
MIAFCLNEKLNAWVCYKVANGFAWIQCGLVISSVLELYKLDKFGYPSTKQGLKVLVGPYLNTLPEDPWGKEYLYLNHLFYV